MVLGADERVCNLVKYRVPDLVSRRFQTKEARQADHSDVVSAASSLSGSIVELKTPTRKTVSMDESLRQPGDLHQPLLVNPSEIRRNPFKQCVGHPIVLAVGASNHGAFGAELSNDTAKLDGLIRERNFVVWAEAGLERVNAEVHGFLPPTLVSHHKAPRNLVFASVCGDDQRAPGRLPCNVPMDAPAKVHEADRVVDGECRDCRLAFFHWSDETNLLRVHKRSCFTDAVAALVDQLRQVAAQRLRAATDEEVPFAEETPVVDSGRPPLCRLMFRIRIVILSASGKNTHRSMKR